MWTLIPGVPIGCRSPRKRGPYSTPNNIDEGAIRLCATRGLIASGLETAAEVDAVVDLLVSGEVLEDEAPTRLVVRQVRGPRGEDALRYTTTGHVERETRLVSLARLIAADKSQALTGTEINDAAARSGLRFDGAHGEAQMAAMRAIGLGGRISAVVGAAGSGKTTLLTPLVTAWQDRQRRVYGVAVAWRQAQALGDVGIPAAQCFAVAAFLARARSGKIALSRETVVILDEVSLVSVKDFLDLLEIQAQFGLTLVAVGDPLQGQAIQAGGAVDLLRRALGHAEVREISTTVRQVTEFERSLAGWLRTGKVDEALTALRSMGRAKLAAGGYDEAVEAVADLWEALTTSHSVDLAYKLAILTSTARDVLAIGGAIRERRRNVGDVGPDLVRVDATDQTGAQFELALAIGDRVRLFARTNARGGRAVLGVNGTVVSVVAVEPDGLVLRNAQGRQGLVAWDTLRDPDTGRIRLSYGDALTVSAGQGLTATEAILALPAGSATIDRAGAYVGLSRHRNLSHLLIGEAADRREVAARRPLGDGREIREADIWENVVRNLSRRDERLGALDLLDETHALRESAAHNVRVGHARIQERTNAGMEPTIVSRARRNRVIEKRIPVLVSWMDRRREALIAIVRDLTRAKPVVRARLAKAAAAGIAPELGQKRRRKRHFVMKP